MTDRLVDFRGWLFGGGDGGGGIVSMCRRDRRRRAEHGRWHAAVAVRTDGEASNEALDEAFMGTSYSERLTDVGCTIRHLPLTAPAEVLVGVRRN